MARAACERAGTPKLCMAGGVALNSVANGRILREAGVTDLYIQPAAGDSGAALGAALFAHHQVLGHPRGFVMEHAAWGQQHGMDAIRAAAVDDRLSLGRVRGRGADARSGRGADRVGSRCSAGSRDASNGGRARSATEASSPTRAAPT